MTSENFCNINNILSCFPVISSELETLGFGPVSYDEDNQKQCIINITNMMWSLILSSKKQVLKINELKGNTLKLKRQLISHEDGKKKCSLILNGEREKNTKLEQSLNQLTAEKENVISELKDLKKELSSIKLSMSGEQIQQQNDIRRKDAIIEDLKSKLFNILDKESKHKTEKTHEEDKCDVVETSVFRKYISSLQNNIQLLLSENVNLRASIVQIYIMVLEHYRVETPKEWKEVLFKLPYQNIIDEIESNVKKILSNKKLS